MGYVFAHPLLALGPFRRHGNQWRRASAPCALPTAPGKSARRLERKAWAKPLYIQLQIGRKTGRKNGGEKRFCGRAQSAGRGTEEKQRQPRDGVDWPGLRKAG